MAANLAADPDKYRIPKPAGVIEMGVVGLKFRQLITLQIYGRLRLQLHDEFDVDGDGQLTVTEAVNGLVAQPKETADQFRSVLLHGDQVLSSTDTPARGALVADAAVAAAGNKDHKSIIDPGMAHLMNITSKFSPEPGEPDQRVIADIRSWLKSHR
ncbi:hypothetical protein [Streptomyces sp. NPDC059455]|uniref:hypothetical protein n=1 Tax=Streptomyces sp. NPDC059455 TaxID=3346837 RepID=UPI0036CE33AD